MYELVSVTFPFADKVSKSKIRPGFVISPPVGRYQQVIVAYVTTQFDEILGTDVMLDPVEADFAVTGLLQKSLLRLHRLGTFQPSALREGQGVLPQRLIAEVREKLMKVFRLTSAVVEVRSA